MARPKVDPWWVAEKVAELILWIALIVVIVMFLTSCRTYESIVGAPEEFWNTLAIIIESFALDILDLVELFL